MDPIRETLERLAAADVLARLAALERQLAVLEASKDEEKPAAKAKE